MSEFDTNQALKLLPEIFTKPTVPYTRLAKKYPYADGRIFKKSEILAIYLQYAGTRGLPASSPQRLAQLRTKPIRSQSGVTPITVLTKPYPCPGECIFCPSDIRMPKSYLSLEPGAQRAASAAFDPHIQVMSRLKAFKEMGHPYQKIELIVLGGTWSVYPVPYRRWFIKRLFDALNDFGNGLDQSPTSLPLITKKMPKLTQNSSTYQFVPPPPGQNYNQAIKAVYGQLNNDKEAASWSELNKVHHHNETAVVRCVGLVLETRPDYISPDEVLTLRRLGATKIQLGIQSLNDQVLKLNRRGHSVNASKVAINLLRQAGFKLHLHWMPNLYGSSVNNDQADFSKLFSHHSLRPDELKIYPCSLIPGTELMTKYHEGKWHPYTHEEITQILSFSLTHTPRYCRISRMVRDIPGHDIAAGNKLTNFRQIAEKQVGVARGVMRDIRAREIRGCKINPLTLKLKTTRYLTAVSREYFLEYVTPTDQIAAFLRLSLPQKPLNPLTAELNHSALIREVHVYGQALDINTQKVGKAQHIGLGKKLIQKAAQISLKHEYKHLSVISAVGTREYYRKLGFTDGTLYQHLP